MAKSIIFANLEPDVEKELRGDFASSRLIRKRIREVLAKKIDSFRSELRQKQLYENPSWAYFQADGIGYERAMHELISLLDDEK